MPKRISKISQSLKQLAEIQVNEWDFQALLNKDIKDLEITQSLRRLGNLKVTDWDFRDVIPAVSRLANQEVDLADLVRRTANYKVMEWDFRNAAPSKVEPAHSAQGPSPAQMQALIGHLKKFLQYVVTNLIDEPGHAQIKVQEIAPQVLRFRLVLVKRDVSMLIGMGGHTAAAIRGILKATAKTQGVQALLQIHSHEEEMALKFRGEI